jgi:4-amino-4-deoxy-L-arabinose transferase-like glycosyltransferase
MRKPVIVPDYQIATPTTLGPRAAKLIALGLLSILAILLIASVRQESQTVDEATHVFAGFEYWKHRDFGRNPEHPPLVKLLASAPLLSMGLREPPPVPIPYFKAQDFVNATQLVYSANADSVLLRARVAVAVFCLALAVLVFVATQEAFGTLAAVFALLLFAFDPNVLANGALVTTDMAFACLLFASVYAFYRYCRRPSAGALALCVVAAALTLVSKHSGVLVIPTLMLLAVVDFFVPSSGDTSASRRDHLRRLSFALVAIIAVSYFAVWAFYGFRYAARPGELQMIPSLAAYAAGLSHPLEHNAILFLARHHVLPEAYLYGWVDILLIPGTRPTFIFGHLYSTEQWFFFPAVFLIKTTLTLLVLLLLIPFARIAERRRELLFFSVPIVFFVLAAILSEMNMGVRYLLPIYPFCIVLAGAAAATLFNRSMLARVAVTALLVLTVLSSLHAYPDFLAYSNELFGGPSHTYRVVADSNADWGQGLKWTKTYLDQHPGEDCWFAYHGNPMIDPAYYGIRCKPLLSGFAHAIGLGAAPVPSTLRGTVLVSTTDTSGLLWGPDEMNPYKIFRDRAPDATIGNIILVYRGSFDVPLLAGEMNAAAASTLLRQGRIAEALTMAQAAAQQAPDSAEVNAVLGRALLASHHVPEGRQAIATALQLAQTKHPEYQKYLVAALQRPTRQP